MNKFLNILSIIGSLSIVFGILFLIQDQTIGRIQFFRETIVWGMLPFKYLIFTATSLIFMLKYVDVYIPNRN